MIKFSIYPKEKGGRSKFGKVLGKSQNYMFFDIFWNILNKMKDNLAQECVKGGLLSFQEKTGKIALDLPVK